MSRLGRHALVLAAVLSLAGACTGKQDAEAAAAETEATSPEPAPSVAAEPSAASRDSSEAPTAEQLPVPADFREEARREVTTTTYKVHLEAIEQELAAEPAPVSPEATPR